jgi:hypothetical protein
MLRPRRCARAVTVLAATAALGLGSASCSSDDDANSGTLGPVENPPAATTGGGTGTGATVDRADAGDATAVTAGSSPTGDVGAGFVSVQVRVATTGVDEVIALDRGTVAADQFDPRSLHATCTALDGGEGWSVAVTDLRRMSAGNRLISASLRVEDPVAGPGPYPGSLEVADNQQMITSYTGTVTLAEGLTSGTFDVADGSGGVATGTFTCGDQPVATTPAPTTGGDEQVPGSSLPGTTVPEVTVPQLTVPVATS